MVLLSPNSRKKAIGPLAVSVNIQLEMSRQNMAAIQSRLDAVQLQRHFPQQSANSSSGDVEVQFSQGPAPPGALHFVMRSSGRNELDMLRQFGRICQLIGVFVSAAILAKHFLLLEANRHRTFLLFSIRNPFIRAARTQCHPLDCIPNEHADSVEWSRAVGVRTVRRHFCGQEIHDCTRTFAVNFPHFF